jgi:hypothetical protein
MDTVAYERWNETEGDDHGLFAHDVHRYDAFNLPDDDAFIFCPECGSLAESFDLIEHKDWCFYGEHRAICPGSF